MHFVEQAGEVARAGRAGFVGDQHRSVVEAARFAAIDGDQQPGDRGRRDARGHLQFVGGDAGVSGADHPVAGALPCLVGGRKRKRLARAGRSGEHVNAVA